MPTEIKPASSVPTKRFSSFKPMKPLLLTLFVSAVLLTGVIAVIFGHTLGYQRGLKALQDSAQKESNNSNLSAKEVKALTLKLEMLKEQTSTAQQERDISLNNLGVMRIDMQDLEVKNLQLQQINDLYVKALSKRGGLPLQIVAEKIEPLPENAFEYRFDVAMLAPDGREHTLTPKLTLLTEDNLVEVPLEPSKYDIKGVARIRGRFVMPEGFTPAQARLDLASNGQTIEQIYDWKTASLVDKMPISLAEIPETDQRPITKE